MSLNQNLTPSKSRNSQTFNDGVVTIYSVNYNSDKGGTPVPVLIKKERLYFEDRIVGFGRFYDAKQNNLKIARLVRCPKRESVSTQDIAVINDIQYTIEQLQYPVPPDKTHLPLMDLTLQRLVENYDLE